MHRRRFISALGGVAAAGLVPGLAAGATGKPQSMPSDQCRPTLRQGEGPFLIESPLRSAISEDRPGVPLRLSLQVLNDFWCQPLENVVVEVWHADASGQYSGVVNTRFDIDTLRLDGTSVDLRGTGFCRGHQVTGADGRVEFTTIYPGWYTGRLSHIHVKSAIRGLPWTSHVTQLYFPGEVEQGVYQSEHYASRGHNPMTLARDLVTRGDKAAFEALTLPLQPDGKGLKAEFTISMNA